MLKKIASLVKPIMRARKWRVKELAEFFPTEANLLGAYTHRILAEDPICFPSDWLLT